MNLDSVIHEVRWTILARIDLCFEYRKLKTTFLITIGIVLIAAFGFGIFFTLNSTGVSEHLPEKNENPENSGISEIPLYEGRTTPNKIPPHYGSAPEVIPPYEDKSTSEDPNL